MRTLLAALLVVSVVGCGPKRQGTTDGGPGDGMQDPDGCVGLQCRVVNCAAMGLPPTTISGTAFAPNGTLALYGVTVYTPNLDPPAFTDGVQCTQCVNELPGEPIARALSDESGKFTLSNVPAGTDIPLILTVGKWRRKVRIPMVNQCTDNPLPAAMTSLPKNKSEGEIPRIAISTGSCDALECLVRKLGVSDSEFTNDTGDGRVHLYNGNGASSIMFNNATLANSTTLWGSLDKLKQYDITLFSCECGQDANTKPQAAMDNMKMYADLGGRVFLSHYHNIWIAGETGVPTHAPAVWPKIATCNVDLASDGTATIDEVNNPKGPSFANWMMNVMGSTTHGQVPITEGRQTCSAIDNTKAERWMFFPSGGVDYPQNFQFTTPNEAAQDARCGKVVFSDMHVASGSFSSGGFPSGCAATAMTPQEKALAFMFFDIASCIQVIQ